MTTCYCCHAESPADLAPDAGWIPSFFEWGGLTEVARPVCPACVARFFRLEDDGEYVKISDPGLEPTP
jgi:hypothetical protein